MTNEEYQKNINGVSSKSTLASFFSLGIFRVFKPKKDQPIRLRQIFPTDWFALFGFITFVIYYYKKNEFDDIFNYQTHLGLHDDAGNFCGKNGELIQIDFFNEGKIKISKNCVKECAAGYSQIFDFCIETNASADNLKALGINSRMTKIVLTSVKNWKLFLWAILLCSVLFLVFTMIMMLLGNIIVLLIGVSTIGSFAGCGVYLIVFQKDNLDLLKKIC